MKSAPGQGGAGSQEDRNASKSDLLKLPRPESQAKSYLGGLAEQINAAHDAAYAAAQTAIDRAVECGRLLIEAKASVRHGEWRDWVEANLRFGERQAQKYMRLARTELPNTTSNSHLTIDGALAALADHREEKPAGGEEDRWWSAPAESRARTCRQWPDIRNSYCLYLHVAGETESDIADRLGLDVREVEQALRPMLAAISSPLVTEVALILLATWRALDAANAMVHAHRDGRTDLHIALEYIERDADARRREHSKRAAALGGRFKGEVEHQLGVTYARAAIGLEAIHPDWSTCLAMHRRMARGEFPSGADAREADLYIPYESLGDATFEDLVAERGRILAHRVETMLMADGAL